jgi:ankyrin repeat protein
MFTYTDIDDQTSLLVAVQSMKLERVQKLISCGAPIKAMAYMRHSALHLSIIAGSRSIQITNLLLASGACSETFDVKMHTLLQRVVDSCWAYLLIAPLLYHDLFHGFG